MRFPALPALFLLMALAALVAMAGCEDSRPSDTLRVGFEAGYRPFEFLDEKSGRFDGFDIALAREFCKRTGRKLTLVNTAWDGIIPSLEKGDIHVIMSGMTIRADRAEKVDFTNPYCEIRQALLIRKEDAGTITSYKSVNSKDFVIALKTGTTGWTAGLKHIPLAKHTVLDTEQDCAREVLLGRAHAFVYDSPYVADAVRRQPRKLAGVYGSFPATEKLGFAVKKGDKALRKELNDFIADVRKDGFLDRAYKAYFAPESP